MKIGELIAELNRYPKDGDVAVKILPEDALSAHVTQEPIDFDIHRVEPEGCNLNDVRIILGNEYGY